jgi:hypothetical protein
MTAALGRITIYPIKSLTGCVGHMLAESRDDVDVGFVLEQVVEDLGKAAGAGVHPRDVGREEQNALRLGANSPPGFGDGLLHEGIESVPRNLVGLFGDPRHVVGSTLSWVVAGG